MENQNQEGGYSREAFEKAEQELEHAKAQKAIYPNDPSWGKDIEKLEAERARLLGLAHKEALEENERRDRQGELPLG